MNLSKIALIIAVVSVTNSFGAGKNWQNVMLCTDDGGNKYHVKTTYDRGQLPQLNTRYNIKAQGALITVSSDQAQIPGYSTLETDLDMQMSRTDNFLSNFTQITSANGQTVLRRYEDDSAVLWQYVQFAVPLSATGGQRNPNGEWQKKAVNCKLQ